MKIFLATRPVFRHACSGRFLAIFLASLFAVLLTACSGGGSQGSEAPVITGPPASLTITEEEEASFSVTATGTAPLHYQWKKGGTNVGSDAAEFRLGSAQLADAGSYTVTVTSNGREVTSPVAMLVVAPLQPVIAAPYQALAGAAGLTASVPAKAGCTFDWTISNGRITAGDKSDAITFTTGTSGYVLISCTVTSPAGTPSTTAMLIVAIAELPVPTITAPAKVSAGMGGFTACVAAQSGLTYAWTIDNGTITAGATTHAITFSAGASGSLQLLCVAINGVGTPSAPGTALCDIVAGPATPVITAPATHTAFDLGTASVPPQAGCTFAWTIAGGDFNGPTDGPSVHYTVSPGTPLRLGCTAINAAGTAGGTGALAIPVTFTNNDILISLNINTNPPPRKKADGITDITAVDHPFGRQNTTLFQIDEVLLTNERSSGLRIFKPSAAYNLSTLGNPSNAADLDSYAIKRPVTADMDGDGKQEVVLACFKGPGQTNDAIAFYQLQGGATRTLLLKRTLAWPGTRNFEAPWHPYDLWDYWRGQDALYRDWYTKIDFASGDIDGDGKDELVLTAEDRLFLLDHDFTPLGERTFTDMGFQVLRVECADLDHDGKAEIIATNGNGDLDQTKTAELSILRYQNGGLFTTLTAPTQLTNGLKALRSGEVKVGDLDGDGVPELVVAGLAKGQGSESGVLRTLVLHVKADDLKLLPNGPWALEVLPVYKDSQMSGTGRAAIAPWYYMSWDTFRERDYAVPALALGDLDEDGRDELVFDQSVLQYVPATAGSPATQSASAVPPTPASLAYAFAGSGENVLRGDSVNCWGPPQRYSNTAPGLHLDTQGSRQKDPAWYGQVAIGKLTSAGDREIYVLDPAVTTALSRVTYYGETRDDDWLRSSGVALRRYRLQAGRLVKETDLALNAESRAPFLCLADLDEDSTRVEYIGTAMMMTKPLVMAVIASPPYWEGLTQPQNTGNMLTSFGQSVGNSTGASATVGASLSGMVGVKGRLPIIANGEIEVKVTTTRSLDFTWDIEANWERRISYETYAGTDAVLFGSVPVDVYAYRVTQGGSSPTLHTGDVVFDFKERPAQLQFTDIEFYNQRNGDEPDIQVFHHTLGKPFSYPTLAQATNLVNNDLNPSGQIQGFLMNNLQSGIVPRGNLYNTMSYDTSLSTGGSVAFQEETSIEVEASFVLLLGAGASGKYGFSAWTRFHAGEGILGSVGGLHRDDYKPENLYRWGIFSYNVGPLRPTVLQAPFGVKVIDYWVERY